MNTSYTSYTNEFTVHSQLFILLQYILDHNRTEQCLTSIGMHIRELIFTTMTNFFNLYGFMNMVSQYVEHQETPYSSLQGVEFHIQTLKYTFPCNMSAREEHRNRRLSGTGGENTLLLFQDLFVCIFLWGFLICLMRAVSVSLV